MYTSSGKVYTDNVTIFFTAICVHVSLTDKFIKKFYKFIKKNYKLDKKFIKKNYKILKKNYKFVS